MKTTFSCKSVLLTTLLGGTVTPADAHSFTDLPTALKILIGRLDAYLQTRPTLHRVFNPVLPAEDFVRHWDSWSNGTRSHLFSARLGAGGLAGAPLDVSKGFDADIPGKPFGGDEDYAFSPDGRTLVFAARIAAHGEPWSTNFDLYEVPVDGSSVPANLTANNPAWDAQPVFLANGDLAYLAMDRPGFESDRFHVVIRDGRSGARRDLTRAIRLVAKADLALRSNPVSKRMVLERLVIDLTTEAKLETPEWMQEQLPV